MEQESIVVVSGLPRSGTSMMMNMLQAGGLPVLTDNIRTANVDNPKGYYELEKVKQLEQDQSWLEEAQGKAVKIIATLLKHLPPTYSYKVIFMRRKIKEVLASQTQMLIRRGEASDTISDEKMAALFERHLERIEAWLAQQPNIEVIYTDYNEVQNNPLAQAKRIDRLMGNRLDVENMAAVVDPSLYRQRK